jgi:hypothetical protein
VDDQSTVTPVPIVAIGHFDDAAAATCPPEDATWCRDLFIIDSVAWAYGHDLGFAGLINDPKVKSTPDEIVQAMGAIDPAARIATVRTALRPRTPAISSTGSCRAPGDRRTSRTRRPRASPSPIASTRRRPSAVCRAPGRCTAGTTAAGWP